METSLHRELKSVYAGKHAQFEVPLGRYRIDVVSRNRLIEIQHGSLAAIRDKIRALAKQHKVLVVKPIVVRKLLVKQDAKQGEVLGRRASPKRGQLIDVFDDLVYFTRVFPHENLTLEIPLVDIEEWRYPGHGRRRRWRENDFEVEDQKLTAVHETYRVRSAADLGRLISCELPAPFHTGDLAEALGVKRWIAQRITYCFRKMGTVRQVGKQGNAHLYRFNHRRGQPPKAPPRRYRVA